MVPANSHLTGSRRVRAQALKCLDSHHGSVTAAALHVLGSGFGMHQCLRSI
jgi:hypothetical protein